MKSISKTGSGIAALGFLLIVTSHNSPASAQVRSTQRRQSFKRIYGQEDTYARTVPVTRRQKRAQRTRLRSLKFQSYNGSGFHFSYGRSGRYGYSSYIDRSSYYQPWYYSPYSYPTYYFGFYGRGYYGYGNYGYRNYGHHHHYPGYYRGFGFGHAPY